MSFILINIFYLLIFKKENRSDNATTAVEERPKECPKSFLPLAAIGRFISSAISIMIILITTNTMPIIPN